MYIVGSLWWAYSERSPITIFKQDYTEEINGQLLKMCKNLGDQAHNEAN